MSNISSSRLLQQALEHHQAGQLPEAEAIYRQILQIEPDNVDALHFLAILFSQIDNNESAVELINKAISINPSSAMYCNLGNILKKLNQLDAAIESYQKSLLLNPNDANTHYNLGFTFQEQNKYDAAIKSYFSALQINPDFVEAHYNLAMAFKEQRDLEAAIGQLHQAISIKPDYADAHNNLGLIFEQQGKLDAAIESYQRTLVFQPDCISAHNNLGNVFQIQGKLDLAIESYQRALSINPDYADAHFNLGESFKKQGKIKEAESGYQQAVALKPEFAQAEDRLFYMQLISCDWKNYVEQIKKANNSVITGRHGYAPFSFLAISQSAFAQQNCAKMFVADSHPPSKEPLWTGQRYQNEKIRIAYVSADFREHAVSFLIAGLLEKHDKERFEIIAISLYPEWLYPEDKSLTGQRIKAAFTQFINVGRKSDLEIAVLMRELEIDIAVDLMGFTQNYRTNIFAYRPAPIQVNYLGFPGTMGAEYIDYIFADEHLIPVEYQDCYTEKIVYLPDCFQANDDKKSINGPKPTRTQVGLPESVFVFCCFNSNYKVSPVFFDVWMRLLKSVPNSVLWLIADNVFVKQNLRTEAINRGIDPERLIFADRLQYANHLARLQLADLFLDTQPFNGGTTASDALWAGVPVITCTGEAFASRMAGSLLNAIGLPELITHSLDEYEALALKVATTPALLAEIKARLAKNRATFPLFNTDRFRRHIETAYVTMWERYQRAEPPVSFIVEPLPEQPKQKCINVPLKSNISDSALLAMGNELQAQGKLNEAIESYQKALSIEPDFAEAHNNLGVVFQKQGKLEAAIECHQRAILIKPDYIDAHRNLGIAFKAQGKLAAASQSYQKALAIKHDDARIDDNVFFLQQECCDWKEYTNTANKIINAVIQGKQACDPSILLAISDSAKAQQICASTFALNECPSSKTPLWTGRIHKHDKIRIAYLSADFYNHATAYLMAELFEAHDKNRFEITAISFSPPNNKGEMRERLERSFDRFLDVYNQNDYEIAALLHNLEIDIAIDLKGYTRHSRPGILAHRPAPIQVNYLGYPGTMGINHIDYIVADQRVIPLEHQAYYTEKVVYLPDSYQVNDSKRQIAERIPTRTELKLPEKDFVFCCFNNNYKITPDIFACWMRLLNKVDNSVLWLLEDNPTASHNLKQEAIARGVNPTRLVFASRVNLDAHLARHQQADLFLDTLPYNAHTTASDALWAGLPVLTCMGSSFASRVAGSLLSAIGLPELITHNLADYEALAFKLATTPVMLTQIQTKLVRNRTISPLFDTDRFRRHIESAYIRMWEIYQHDEKPSSFTVQPIQHMINKAQIPIPRYDFFISQNLVQNRFLFSDGWPVVINVVSLKSDLKLYSSSKATRLKNKYHWKSSIGYQPWQPLTKIFFASPINQSNSSITDNDCNESLLSAEHNYNQANRLKTAGKSDLAIEYYHRAIALKANYAEAYYQIGNIFLGQGNLDVAIENYRLAITSNPGFADAYCNLGVAFKEQGEWDSAVDSYRHALAITPNDAEVYSNLGETLWKQGKLDAAIENYQHALSFNPNAAGVHNNLGVAFKEQGKLDLAVESYQRALLIEPDYSDAYGNLGAVFQEQGKLEAATESLKKALSFNPDYTEAFDSLFNIQLRCCDWSEYDGCSAKIIKEINEGQSGYTAFSFLAISDSLETQQKCAQILVNKSYPASKVPMWTGQRYQHDKIRIAYISADFREHPSSYLMAGLFEKHDRQRFEIIAISLRPADDSPTCQRVKTAFDQFIDTTDMSDYEIASLVRGLEIDIAVDLMGFTRHCKVKAFAYRFAPIQINYLGYPGGMGANYMDYIFADAYLIPPESRRYYTEKVVYLPDCFQANDDKRIISAKKPTRTEAGLPESGFVFCSFNNSYKINPLFFALWMRLLKAVPNSVLWLVTDNQTTQNNLRKEATKHGVNADRLVFANGLIYPDHLARFQLADLFLDTLPFNAGTTASDALWAGVPVITCSGEAFAARMAGSLLQAIGLPELITQNLAEYEALAFKLATTPNMLAEIRSKLARNRSTYPLFDTALFCQHIETAYAMMWERYQRGELPVSFSVPSLKSALQ